MQVQSDIIVVSGDISRSIENAAWVKKALCLKEHNADTKLSICKFWPVFKPQWAYFEFDIWDICFGFCFSEIFRLEPKRDLENLRKSANNRVLNLVQGAYSFDWYFHTFP